MTISWTITADNTAKTVKFATSGSVPIDLTQLVVDDYVVISGTMFNSLNRGSYKVTDVVTYYVGSTLNQYFVVENEFGVSEGPIVQTAASDIEFFRPSTATIQASSARTVSLAQTNPGQVKISIPATSGAVNRTKYTAMYPNEGRVLDVVRATRHPNGYVECYTKTPHGLEQFDIVNLKNYSSCPVSPWVGVNDNEVIAPSNTSHFWMVPSTLFTGFAGTANAAVKLTNGSRVCFAGGHQMSGGGVLESDEFRIFQMTGSSPNFNTDEAFGHNIVTYSWAHTNLSVARHSLAASELLDGRVMVTGGYLSPFTVSNAIDIVQPAGPTLDFSTTNANAKRAGHAQYTLRTGTNAGKVIVIGGALDQGNATNTTYLFNSDGSGFGAGASMSKARCDFGSCMLSDGKIMVGGGRLLGQAFQTVTNTVAQWDLDDGSANATDATATYTLTGVGPPAVVNSTKIGKGRNLVGAGVYFQGTTSASANLLGDWSVEFWIKGYSNGVVVSHGGTTDIANDNKLLEIELLASTITARWESGAGSDTVLTSASLTNFSTTLLGSDPNYWNHFVVTKAQNGSNWDVSFYINGTFVSTASTATNATGGSAGVFWLGRDPEAVRTDFNGILDCARVVKRAFSHREVVESYTRGAGHYNSEWNNLEIIGEITNECELYDPVANTWTALPKMTFARAWFSMLALPDDRVACIGGQGYDPSNWTFYEAPNSLFVTSLVYNNTISRALAEAEVYEPNVHKWVTLPKMSIARRSPAAEYLKYTNKILVATGYIQGQTPNGQVPTAGNEVSEYLDILTYRWKLTPHQVSLNESRVGSKLIAVVDNATFQDVAVLEGSYNSTLDDSLPPVAYHAKNDITDTGSLNGDYHVHSTVNPLTSVLDPNIVWLSNFPQNVLNLSYESKLYGYSSNFGPPFFYQGSGNSGFSTAGGDGFGWKIDQIQRVSDVVTVTVHIAGAVEKFTVQPGDYVHVNNLYSGYTGAGIKLVDTVTIVDLSTATFTYSEVGSDFDSTLAVNSWGAVSKQWSTPTLVAYQAQEGNVKGPYIFDPKEGLPITGVFSKCMSVITEGAQVGTITLGYYGVDQALLFPDEEGYLIFGFGTKDEVGPVKYFGRAGTDALIIDYSFVFPKPVLGIDVTLLAGLSPFSAVFDDTIQETFLTSSASGRIAAIKQLENTIAAGFDSIITVKYPGDRGLGAEGFPTEGQKLSDKVKVFGGDNLDQELADARKK